MHINDYPTVSVYKANLQLARLFNILKVRQRVEQIYLRGTHVKGVFGMRNGYLIITYKSEVTKVTSDPQALRKIDVDTLIRSLKSVKASLMKSMLADKDI